MKPIETERLLIDPIKEGDKEDYFVNISHDKKVLETFICNYAETLEEFDFSRYLGREELFAIRKKEDRHLIGIILYFDAIDGQCEVGYGIGSRFWNQGYTTEALRAFLRFLFCEKGFNKVYASHFPENTASRRVMEKCGMRYSHTNKKELTYLEKERDLIYYVKEKGETTMEEQIVKITIQTKGEECQMSDAEIKAWYKEKIASLFNPAYGTPEINVELERKKK